MSCIRIVSNSGLEYSLLFSDSDRWRIETARQNRFPRCRQRLIANSAKSLFAFSNQLFCVTLLRNVLDCAEHADRLVVAVKLHLSKRFDDADRPVWTQYLKSTLIGMVVTEPAQSCSRLGGGRPRGYLLRFGHRASATLVVPSQ